MRSDYGIELGGLFPFSCQHCKLMRGPKDADRCAATWSNSQFFAESIMS